MNRAFPLAILMFLGFLAPAAVGQAVPDAQVKQRVNAAVQGHINWTKQYTSAGASIQAKEVLRRPDAVQYELFVAGLPTDTLYTAVSWKINGTPERVMEGITIGKGGALECAGKTPAECGNPKQSKDDSPIDFTFYPQKGEPYRMAFISSDSKSKVAIVIVPDPIEANDKSCSINAVRLTPKFELAFISGTGFAPNTEVTFEMQSWDEKHEIPQRADAAGSLQFAILPGVAGHDRGTTTVKALGATCAPSLQFDWGPVNITAGGK